MLEWLFERKEVNDLIESIRKPNRCVCVCVHVHFHVRRACMSVPLRVCVCIFVCAPQAPTRVCVCVLCCRYASQRMRMDETGFRHR
jgi:hypothetical protein